MIVVGNVLVIKDFENNLYCIVDSDFCLSPNLSCLCSLLVQASIAEQHHSKASQEFNLNKDNLPLERALGLNRCIETDVTLKDRPHTQRGILAVVNSIYDPFCHPKR